MKQFEFKTFIRQQGALIGFIVLALALAITTDGAFLSSRNLTNLIRQASINGILAGGMTYVILTGGIDLSIGSIVALCGIAIGLAQTSMGLGDAGLAGTLDSVALGIAVGVVAGFINGALITGFKIAPFVITLGMMVIARGLALILSNGATLSPMSPSLVEIADGFLDPTLSGVLLAIVAAASLFFFVKDKDNRTPASFLTISPLILVAGLLAYSFVTYRGLPYLAISMGVVLGVLALVLKRTVFGRSIVAIGSNERAAYFAGLSIGKARLAVYTIMGALSGLAAVLLTSRLNSADPNAGQLFELDAIAAVVIGGTSLKGGQGTILGSLVGALTIATLGNGMDLLGVPSFYQMVLKGLVIVFAVAIDRGQADRA